MRRHTTLIFDLDGTLVDATENIVETFNYVLSANGLDPWTRSQVLELMGKPLFEMFRRIDIDADHRELVKQYVGYSRGLAGRGVRLLPGARTLLKACCTRYRLGVNTSRTQASALRILSGLGVDHFLPDIVGVDQVSLPKPHPDGIVELLERFEVAPEEVVMLGDTPDDVRAARSAAVEPLAVATGYYSAEQLREAGATEVFEDLAGFREYLDRG